MSAACMKVLQAAARSRNPGQELVAIDHVIYAVVQVDEIHAVLRESVDLNPDLIRKAIIEIRSTKCLDISGNTTSATATATATTTSNLKFNQETVVEVPGNPPSNPVGYEDETREIIRIFSRITKKTPIIVGKSEMTKKLVTDGLASFILSSKVPSELERSQVLHVPKKFLETGAGNLDKRCKYIYDSVSMLDKPVILCIDIPCRHIEGGDGDTVNIIQLLEPALGAKQIRCLITTTPDEFNEAFSSDDRIPHSEHEVFNNLETTNKINILDHAIIAAANLATHFLPEKSLPDCAIDVIDEAAAAAIMELHCGTKETITLEKQMRQLEIEISSLNCDGTPSTDRLAAVAYGQMAAIRKKYDPIHKQHEERKQLGQSILETEQKLGSLVQLLDKRKREGDLQIALDLKYYAIPETRDRLSCLRKQYAERYSSLSSRRGHENELLFPVSVTSETIHDIVSKRTRIEVSVLKGTNKSGVLDMSYRRSISSCSVASALLSHNDYSIGWICPLAVEMAAAQLMLAKLHLPLKSPENDPNQYILGSIGNHNVVITCLPHGVPGSTSATVVAERMNATFRSLKYILLVGIGGGVPDHTDIRLGDVVVSQQIIQYDYGKAMANGKFERIGQLAKPAPALLTAMSRIETNHLSDPSHISRINYW
ncbi:unnamed protein product [Penicillium pancosmium]